MKPSQIAKKARRWRHVVQSLRYGIVIATAIVAALQLVLQFNLWEPPSWVLPVLIALILAGTVIDNVRALRGRARAEKKLEQRIRLREIVTSALVEVGNLRSIPVESLGISVWRLHSRRGREPVLSRVVRVRLGDYPQPSDTAWTKGKGVIGDCWRKCDPSFKDWRALQRKYAKAGEVIEERAWRRQKERFGFEREEFLAAIRKYAQVLAVPIVDEHGSFEGCISVDVFVDGVDDVEDGEPQMPKLDSGATRKVISTQAKMVRDLI